jgi:hypothetical protein
MADGTAPKCGRVGSCHIYYQAFQFLLKGFFIAVNGNSLHSKILIMGKAFKKNQTILFQKFYFLFQ